MFVSLKENSNNSICGVFFQAYCHTFVVRTFSQIVSDAEVDKSTKDVLTALCKLYAIDGIIENLGEFIQVHVKQC